LTDFQKNSRTPKFKKVRLVEAEIFHNDGRTGGRTDRRIDRPTIWWG